MAHDRNAKLKRFRDRLLKSYRAQSEPSKIVEVFRHHGVSKNDESSPSSQTTKDESIFVTIRTHSSSQRSRGQRRDH